jgi:cation diffusion facilitator family transporter
MAESRLAVYGAMAANVAIAVTKFIAAGVTGSASMLSEGIHSIVDTANDALLLVGMERSKKKASQLHPFGHGRELYFWSLIVAVLIFGLGGGVSMYEGLLHILNPRPLEEPFWNYVVLGCSAVFEGISFAIAMKQFNAARADDTSILEAVHVSKDPSSYTIVAEDAAALGGLVIAAAGVYLSHVTRQPAIDGVASMLIGLLLCGVAIVLIRESRGLLVGEGVKPETVKAIRQIVRGEPHVRDVGPVLSMYLGADEVLVTIDVQFAGHLPAEQTAQAIQRIEDAIRERFPKIKRIYIEAVKA